MYRRAYGQAKKSGKWGGGGDEPPKAVRNKAKERERRHSAPTLGTCRRYGPKKNKDRHYMDWKFLRRLFPLIIGDLEKRDKDKEEEEEKSRVPEKEVEKLAELTVKKINFHMKGKSENGTQPKIAGNSKSHHTDKYHCTKSKDPQPVLRRGQEFRVTITFNRPYNKEQDDLLLTVEAEEDGIGKNLQVFFCVDEKRDKPFKEGQEWAARIKKMKGDKVKLAIYIPGNCAVGEWDLKVKTSMRGSVDTYEYVHPKPFVVLFNPWSKQDQVYYEDQADLKEYVLNDQGTAYYGCATFVQCKPWTYGQFDEGILQISLSLLRQAFGFKMTPAMADPIRVSRALSRIVNAGDDSGVLVGNWSGDYEGGTSPLSWTCSTAILKEYVEKEAPVQFGQCWVFSHVLTAVCRALGLPCRSVTNFDSAHDTDESCTIDYYYNTKGDELKGMKSDSIWNFHVWNEVWIQRPDIPEHDVNGWHAIDATPQETSEGVYQCGPCPVKAVKNGLIHLGYDTPFIFGEVNADVVHWIVQENGEITPSAYKQRSVGSKLSTKPATGKPHAGNMGFWEVHDPKKRMDLTDQYKHKEGSEEERVAVKRAVRQTFRGADLYKKSADLEVSFEEHGDVKLGEDLTVTALVKNVSKEEKKVELLMSARTCSYYNNSDCEKELCKETPDEKRIAPGGVEKVQMTVPCTKYFGKIDENLSVFVYVRAKDLAAMMPFTAQQPFMLGRPDLLVEGPKEAKPGEVVTLKATFTNPVAVPLTECQLFMHGGFRAAEDDANNFKVFYGAHCAEHRDIKAGETVTLTIRVYREEEEVEEDDDDSDDEEEEEGAAEAAEEETRTQVVEFYCKELSSLVNSITLTLCKHH